MVPIAHIGSADALPQTGASDRRSRSDGDRASPPSRLRTRTVAPGSRTQRGPIRFRSSRDTVTRNRTPLVTGPVQGRWAPRGALPGPPGGAHPALDEPDGRGRFGDGRSRRTHGIGRGGIRRDLALDPLLDPLRNRERHPDLRLAGGRSGPHEKLRAMGLAGDLRVDAGRDRVGCDSRLGARARARVVGSVAGDAHPDRGLRPGATDRRNRLRGRDGDQLVLSRARRHPDTLVHHTVRERGQCGSRLRLDLRKISACRSGASRERASRPPSRSGATRSCCS